MQTPIQIIETYGAPTNSFTAAVHHFKFERAPLSKSECEAGIAQIVGADQHPTYRNAKEANLYFLYVVQETVRAFNGGVVPEMADIWEVAQRRAVNFITDNPWAIKDYTSDEGDDVVDGQPKQKKGAKKDQAEALYRKMNDGKNDRNTIIQALVDEVGMSKAGATTYFHNLKKTVGFSGPKTEKVKREKKVVEVKPKGNETGRVKKSGPSKGEVAKRIYAEMVGSPKDEIIARIVEETGTTVAGANTYFCMARKEFN